MIGAGSFRRGLRIAALGTVLFLMLGIGAVSSGQAAERYEDLAERHRLQDTFPGGEPDPESEPREPSGFEAPIGSVDISSLLLWGLGGGILLVLAVLIFQNVRAYRIHGSKYRTEGAADEPVEVWGTVPDDGWDALIQRLRLSGDFNVALHDMLLAAIGFCQKELAIHIPRAQTPREIISSLPAGFMAADDFETLVHGAELAWFGGKPVTRDQFQQGLAALERIVRL